jgi:lipopolysaccharide export LptBFGC system permease protein LptF
MSVAHRQMLWRVIGWTIAIMATLLVVIMVIDPFGLYDLYQAGGMSLADFLLASALGIPTLTCHAGPLSTAIAAIVLYHRWIRDGQILGMRSVGMSAWSISLPALAAALITGLCTAASSLYLIGATFPALSDLVFVGKYSLHYATLREGRFNPVTPNIGLWFERRVSATELGDVVVADRSDPLAVNLVWAKTGAFEHNRDGDFLVLRDGRLQREPQGGTAGERVVFEQMRVQLRPHIDANARGKGFYELHLGSLLAPPSEVARDSRDFRSRLAEGHHRIVTAALCFNYALLVLGVLLRKDPVRRGLTLRITVLLTSLAGLHTGLVMVHVLVVQGTLPVHALYLFAVLPAVVGAMMLLAADHVVGAGALLRLSRPLYAVLRPRQAEDSRRATAKPHGWPSAFAGVLWFAGSKGLGAGMTARLHHPACDAAADIGCDRRRPPQHRRQAFASQDGAVVAD